MAKPASRLSDDPETLKAQLVEAQAENERLRQIILAMQRHRFGRRAESLPEDQLLLGLEEAEQVEAAGFPAEEAKPAKKAARVGKRRTNCGALPAHLPRVETLVDINGTACPCCSGALHKIGEDVSERLDVVPAQFWVLVICRPRYACRACEDAFLQAPAPVRLIEGGLPTDALVAQVIASKYADHLPLYRQAQIFLRQGVVLDRSTLADWVGRAAFLLRPVHARLLETLKRSSKLFADETTAPVLDTRTRAHQDRSALSPTPETTGPGADPIHPVSPTSTPPTAPRVGRSRIWLGSKACYRSMAMRLTKSLAKGGAIRLAYCWSHARRLFYELAAASPIATEALARIAALYRIEAEIRGCPADERRAVRQERSRSVIEALEPWLREKLGLVSRKSKLADAIRYALSRWAGLSLFLDDGRVEIDSNIVERAIRPLALNRENALFAGSDGGGQHWAVIASLIETCKLVGVEPHAYLADIITRIVEGHPQRRLNDLLPWAYPAIPALKAAA